jgi:hypothetical protein
MKLYPPGAYVRPGQRPDGQWQWVVAGFEDDTFDEDGRFVSVPELAATLEVLTENEYDYHE